MEKRKKKIPFLNGWILRINRLEELTERLWKIKDKEKNKKYKLE